MGTRGCGRGEREFLSNGYSVSVWKDENFLEMYGGDSDTAMCVINVTGLCTEKG